MQLMSFSILIDLEKIKFLLGKHSKYHSQPGQMGNVLTVRTDS